MTLIRDDGLDIAFFSTDKVFYVYTMQGLQINFISEFNLFVLHADRRTEEQMLRRIDIWAVPTCIDSVGILQ